MRTLKNQIGQSAVKMLENAALGMQDKGAEQQTIGGYVKAVSAELRKHNKLHDEKGVAAKACARPGCPKETSTQSAGFRLNKELGGCAKWRGRCYWSWRVDEASERQLGPPLTDTPLEPRPKLVAARTLAEMLAEMVAEMPADALKAVSLLALTGVRIGSSGAETSVVVSVWSPPNLCSATRLTNGL